jgi:hypothetical protein
MTLEQLRAMRPQILALAQHYGASHVRVFGSVARDEARPDSDVDFLVTYSPETSFFDHVGFIQALQDLLGCAVDVSTDETLHWVIRERILSEAVPL